MRLTVVYTREDDKSVFASVPSLPGCISWGKTLRDARRNIAEAMQLYLEDMIEQGEPLPKEIQAEAVTIAREVQSVALRLGFNLVRQSGSHRVYRHGDGRRVVIPFHPGDIRPKTLEAIIVALGIS